MRGRTRSSRSSGTAVAPVRACTCVAQVLERDLARTQPLSHRAGQRERLEQRQRGGDPRDAEAVDRGVDRRVDTDEQRRLDEELRNVACSLARCRGELGVVEVDEVGLVARVDDHVLEREVAVRDPRVVEHADLGPEAVEERPIDARSDRLGHALADDEVGDEHRRAVRRRDDADEPRRLRAAVGRAVERERFVLDAALHGGVRRLDLVPAASAPTGRGARGSRRCGRPACGASRTATGRRSPRRDT